MCCNCVLFRVSCVLLCLVVSWCVCNVLVSRVLLMFVRCALMVVVRCLVSKVRCVLFVACCCALLKC